MASISVKRRDTLLARFPFVEDGEPANLAGCSARMQLRDRRLKLYLDVSTDDYLSIDEGAVVTDVPALMMDIPVGRYQADIELTFSNGAVRSSKTFEVKVVQDVTFEEA